MQDWSFKLLGRVFMFAIANWSLIGCSSTTLSYKDTLVLALFKGEDVVRTLTEIQQLKIPGLYVRKNDNARALLSLRDSDALVQKWVSADGALIVVQHGRLV